MIAPETADFLNNYFDKIFVITLERATERQKKVSESLASIKFDFFTGVDKRNFSGDALQLTQLYDDRKARKLNRYGKGMIPGHIACALSHRNLYQHIIDQGYKRVLIFEDDVLPLEDNLPLLPIAINELPPDWEMIYFGYAKNESATPALVRKQRFYKLIRAFGLIKWSQQMISNLLPKNYSPHLKIAGFHDLLHGYAVTSEACKKLVLAQTPVVFNSDPLVSHLIMNGELKAFISIPQFFIQEQALDPAHQSFIHHL